MSKRAVWLRRILCVPVTVIFIALVYILDVPNPMMILTIPVVYFTYLEGYVGGGLSGATAVAYACYFFLIKNDDPAGGYKVATIILSVSAIILLVGRLDAKLRQRGDTLAHMAATDALTGVMNRHAFFERAKLLYDRGRQTGRPVCLLFLDIDYFKNVNDCYGHSFGDAVLVRLSQALGECLRSSDISCRYGGDEFAVLLADVDTQTAQTVAGRIVERVRRVRFEEYPDFRLTVSIGVSGMIPDGRPGVDLLLRSADAAMYQAKHAGRDRIVVRLPEPGENAGAAACAFDAAAREGERSSAAGVGDALTQDVLLHAMDQLLDMVYVVDVQTYELLYINQAGRKKYGIGDPKSRKCHELLYGLPAPCPFCINDALRYNEIHTWEFTNEKLGRRFLMRDGLVYWNGRKARMQIATDITGQAAGAEN